MLRYGDITRIQEFINLKYKRILELEKLAPSPENLAEVRKITREAKDLKDTIVRLKGNTYPYAS